MRRREYLSPSAIKAFDENPEEFYIKYLAENRSERDPQTQAMSIGSAFDAYVKCSLHEKIYGKGYDPVYELESLFEQQVEEQHRDWAWRHGKYVFDCYVKSNAYADLLLELQQSTREPHFEIEIRGTVGEKKLVENSVVLLGKPDLHWVNKEGNLVVIDWKVNGYCSKSAKSPEPGYIRVRSCDNIPKITGHHSLAHPIMYKGMYVSLAHTLEKTNKDWGSQLAIYGWLLGEKVGSGFITGIDQIVAKPSGTEYPILRVAEHRTIVDPDYQIQLHEKCERIWEIINSDHIFRDMTIEQSKARAQTLENKAKAMANMRGTDVWKVLHE